MKASKLQPALLAGVAIGVLSALPVISIGNVCCCLWVVCGGALAAYLLQQNQANPVDAGDGAIVGLMAGAAGAIVYSVLALAVSLVMGPFQSQMIDWLLTTARDLPPEAREMLEEMRGGMMGGALAGIGFIVGSIFSLFVFSIFGLVGGLLGAVMFKKPLPPPPPPPSGFSPATFNPPSSFNPPPPPPPPVA